MYGPRFLSLLMVTTISPLASGCLVTIHQSADLRFMDKATGKPATAASVHMVLPVNGYEWTDEEWLQDRPRVVSLLTNAQGRAKLNVRRTFMYLAPVLPWDIITGKTYVCSISNDAYRDVFRVTINRDASAGGDHFTVSVMSIGWPTFIPLH